MQKINKFFTKISLVVIFAILAVYNFDFHYSQDKEIITFQNLYKISSASAESGQDPLDCWIDYTSGGTLLEVICHFDNNDYCTSVWNLEWVDFLAKCD